MPATGGHRQVDDKIQTEIVERLRHGVDLETTVKAAGINLTIYERWLKRGERTATKDKPYRAFAIAVEQAKADAEAILVKRISNAAADDWKAAAWLLERKWPERWTKTVVHQGRKAEAEDVQEPVNPGEAIRDELAERRAT